MDIDNMYSAFCTVLKSVLIRLIFSEITKKSVQLVIRKQNMNPSDRINSLLVIYLGELPRLIPTLCLF